MKKVLAFIKKHWKIIAGIVGGLLMALVGGGTIHLIGKSKRKRVFDEIDSANDNIKDSIAESKISESAVSAVEDHISTTGEHHQNMMIDKIAPETLTEEDVKDWTDA